MSKRFEDKVQELWHEVGNMLLEPDEPSKIVELVPPTEAEAAEQAVEEEFFLEVPSQSDPSKTHRYDANHVSSHPQRNVQMLAYAMQAILSNDRVDSARRFAHALLDAI